MRRSWGIVLGALLGSVAVGAESRAAVLSTTFESGHLGGAGWTNLFDLQVDAVPGVTISALTVHTALNAPPGVTVYVHPLTYVGNESSSTGWVQVSSGQGASPGFGGGASTIDVADFVLPTGTYGIAITNDFQVLYSSGDTNYGDGNLLIDNGATLRGSFGSTLDTPRVWNGQIFYTVGVPEPASTAVLALAGCGLLARRRR